MTTSWEDLFERAETHECALEAITDELARRRKTNA